MGLCKKIYFCFIFTFLILIFPSSEARKHNRGKLRNGGQRTVSNNGSQKAAKMCDKYTRQACHAPSPPNSGARIAGGKVVKGNKFPHMATLGNPHGYDDWYCGASLISESYLLTAAHCLYDDNHTLETLKYVRMGDLDLRSHKQDTHAIVGKVLETIVNPWYQDNDTESSFADIALIKIEPINFTDYVRPICLNTNASVPNVTLSITGWGLKEDEGEASAKLREAEIYQLGSKICQKSTSSYDDRTMMCAGLLMGGKDACDGDSGGPLQMPVNDLPYGCNVSIWSQVGIISSGAGCAEAFHPSIYVRVSYFIDWIANIVWKDT